MIRKMSLAAALLLSACVQERVVDLPGPQNPVFSIRGDASTPPPAPDAAEIVLPDAAEVVPDAGDTTPDAQVIEPPDSGACVPDHESCGNGAPCCEGFCSDELGAYSEGICYLPLEDGAFCLRDEHCDSGTCEQNACVRQCSALGEGCYGPIRPCCEGLICSLDPNSYGQGNCVELLPAGAFCQAGEECAGGECTDNVCSK